MHPSDSFTPLTLTSLALQNSSRLFGPEPFPFWSRIASSLLNPTVADSINEVTSQPKALAKHPNNFLYALSELVAMPRLRLVGG